jgi:hypothetical protein
MAARISGLALFLALAAIPAEAQDGAGRAGSVDLLRFAGPERAAVERCAPLVERFGRMRIDSVRASRGGWRVDGTVAGAAIGDSNGWRKGFAPRAFTCTVAADGRARLKTSKLSRF